MEIALHFILQGTVLIGITIFNTRKHTHTHTHTHTHRANEKEKTPGIYLLCKSNIEMATKNLTM